MTKPTRQEVTAWIRELGCDMTTAPRPIPSRSEILGFNAIVGGCVIRPATPKEIADWLEINNLSNHLTADPCTLSRAWAFSKPVYSGGILIDTDTGPGSNMVGMPLG